MNRIWVALFLFSCCLVGCTTLAGGPLFSRAALPRGQALVIVYRPEKYTFDARKPDLFVNGKNRFELLAGGYEPLALSPATYDIEARGSLDMPSGEVRLRVDAGKTYYLRYDATAKLAQGQGAIDEAFFSGIPDAKTKKVNPVFFQIKEAYALGELRSLHRISSPAAATSSR